MLSGPFPPWPNFTEEEADAVKRVLLSNKVNYWTGDEGRQFEEEFAAFAGAEYAIALANGTVAIDLALHGLDIGDGHEVIVTPRSFMASVSSVVNAGATPVFADIDPDSQNISPQSVAPHITDKTRAILCVHLAGWPCDIDGFKKLIGDRDIKIIEDCAQAHGATYKGQPVGALGDVGAWSFCQDKIMTTGGEGGMVTCNDRDLWSRMWSFKDHGKSWDAVYNRDHPQGFRWVHESFGTNWRLTETQSVIGRIQLRRMKEWTAIRNRNAQDLIEVLSPYAGESGILRLPRPSCSGCDGSCDRESGCTHAWYKFYAFVRTENLPSGVTRDDVIARITEEGLPCMQGTCSEIYKEKAFEGTGFAPTQSLPVARQLGETSIMFMTHPGVERVSINLDDLL